MHSFACHCILNFASQPGKEREREEGRNEREKKGERGTYVSPCVGGAMVGAERTSTSRETGAFRIITPGKWHFKWLMGIKKKKMFRLTRSGNLLPSLFTRVCYAPSRKWFLRREGELAARLNPRNRFERGGRIISLPLAASLFGGGGWRAVLHSSFSQQREIPYHSISYSAFVPRRRGRLIRAYYSAYTIRGKIFAWSNRLVKSCAISQIDY